MHTRIEEDFKKRGIKLENQGNCFFWAFKKVFLYGGRVKIKKSRTWIGFHSTWVSPWGKEYEYTLPHAKKQPWWYVPFVYPGVIKEVKNDER